MPTIRALRRLDDTIARLGGAGDNWHMSWANDDRVYTSLCDGEGWPDMPQAPYNSRLYAIEGEAPDLRFVYLPGYPELLTASGRNYSRYYNFGTLALDGSLYQFLSTPNVPFGEPNPRFAGVKLIVSPDNGATWTNQDGTNPVVWEPWEERSRDNMLFFFEEGDAFSLITVLQMGRNYEHNRDGYVYLYAPNGNVEGTMNQVVLCRTPRSSIADRSAYRFYAGDGKWSHRVEDRAVLVTGPAGWVNRFVHPYAWHPSVVYYPATGQYLMANWGMGIDAEGNWFGRPSYLGFWTAPEPWGPWTQVHEDGSWTPGGDQAARCYQPQVAPRWMAADGSRFWLVWTDFQTIDGGRPYYAFNMQQVAVDVR